ncbi:MAG: glycoside hydrolase family 15 protein [Candidatus Caenarcaniphilales bacterium]|nr:glycoside hydrolase family 15 protein [Candidatus Caenarcaniphilales bacterium]
MPNKFRSYPYGLIGNCRLCALVSDEGSIDWLCVPRFDGPSVFARILDKEKGGFFSIAPVDRDQYTTSQQYIKNTNILITRFESNQSGFEILDYLPCYQKGDQLQKPLQLHRIVRVLKGTPLLRVIFNPSFRYGQSGSQIRVFSDCIYAHDGHRDDELYLYTNIPKDYILNCSTGIDRVCIPSRGFTLHGSHYFILSCEPLNHLPQQLDIEREFHATKYYWQRWVQSCNIPAEYQKEVIRSALALKLMIYDDTGAVIASPTTSLPEVIGKERNWDYRYCWLRDAYFAINALTNLSRISEAEKFIDYIKSTLAGNLSYIRPIYCIDGNEVPEEQSVDLAGYEDSKPVRVGNSATFHHQDDVYGEVILSLYPLFFDERFVRGDLYEIWESVKKVVEIALIRFDQTDQGIWEFRGEAKHYTFSKLLLWVAADRGARIALKMHAKDEARRWRKAADRMKETILEKCWSDELKSFTQSYERRFHDASNLLIAHFGLIPPTDQRIRMMVDSTKESLCRGDYVYRYVNQDDFGEPESAFLICSFWLVDLMAVSGRRKEAREYFEKLLRASNHLGLFAEDIDPKNGRLLGNFPQGYSHVAVINSALLLAR